MRHGLALGVCLFLGACLTSYDFGQPQLGGSSAVLTTSNVPLNGAAFTVLSVALKKDDGTPLPGIPVDVSAENCNVTQALPQTDANGTVSAVIASAFAGQHPVTIAVQQGTFAGALPHALSINFYVPSAVGNGTNVAPGTLLNAEVWARDSDGHVRVNYTGVVHFVSSDSKAALPPPYTMSPNDAGYAVVPDAIAFHTSGTQTVSAVDASGATLSTQTFNVSAGNAAMFEVSLGSPTLVVSHPATLKISAHDKDGNLAPTYTGTVLLTTTDTAAALPTSVVFGMADAGVRTLVGNVTFNTPGAQTLYAQDANVVSLQSPPVTTQIITGPATSLTVSTSLSCVAGQTELLVVRAVDASGHTATTFTGAVTITTSDLSADIPAQATFTLGNAGVLQVPFSFHNSGNQNVSVAAGPLQASVQGIFVSPGKAARFVLSGSAFAMLAGSPLNVSLLALDRYGNVDTGYSGVVALQSTDPQAALPTGSLIQQGEGEISVTLKSAGVQAITIADQATPSINGTLSGLFVSPTTPSHLRIDGLPSTATSGTATALRVSARDPFDNINTAYTGVVHFLADANTTAPPDAALLPANQGNVTLSAPITLSGTGLHWLSASDSGVPALSSGRTYVTVTPATAASLTATGFPVSVVTEQNVLVTVTVYDASSNVATGYTGTVHLSSSDANANLPADYQFTAADAGTHVFNVALNTVGTQWLRIADAAHASLSFTQTNITVLPTCHAYGQSLVGSGITGDSYGLFAQAPALALDHNNSPLVAWSDGSQTTVGTAVYLRQFENGNWVGIGNAGDGNGLAGLDRSNVPWGGSIQVGSGNQIWVAWTSATFGLLSAQIRVAGFDGNAWTQPATSPNGLAQFATSQVVATVGAALTRQELPVVVYAAPSGVNALFYDGNAWQGYGGTSIVVGNSNVLDAYLVLDGNDAPYVAWIDNNAGRLLHVVHWSGTAWTPIALEAGVLAFGSPVLGRVASMAMGVSGTLYLAYSDSQSPSEVRLLTYNEGVWADLGGSSTSTGLSNTPAGSSYSPSVALDSQEHPVVTWTDTTSGSTDIYMRRWNGATWVEENSSAHGRGITPTTGFNYSAQLAIDANGIPVIAWNYQSPNGASAIYVCRWY